MMASGAYFYIGVQPQKRASLPCFVGSQGLSSGSERFFKQSESTYSRKLASTKNLLGNWACGIQGSHKLVSGSTVCITLALYRLADLGLGPYLLLPGVLS